METLAKIRMLSKCTERRCTPGVYTDGERYFQAYTQMVSVISDGHYLGLLQNDINSHMLCMSFSELWMIPGYGWGPALGRSSKGSFNILIYR